MGSAVPIVGAGRDVVTTDYMDEAERCGSGLHSRTCRADCDRHGCRVAEAAEANPAGTSAIQIRYVANPSEMLDGIRHMPGVREATIFGHSIHALAETDRLSEMQTGTQATNRDD